MNGWLLATHRMEMPRPTALPTLAKPSESERSPTCCKVDELREVGRFSTDSASIWLDRSVRIARGVDEPSRPVRVRRDVNDGLSDSRQGHKR